MTRKISKRKKPKTKKRIKASKIFRVKAWGATAGGGWSTVYFRTKSGAKRSFPSYKVETLRRLPRKGIYVNR